MFISNGAASVARVQGDHRVSVDGATPDVLTTDNNYSSGGDQTFESFGDVRIPSIAAGIPDAAAIDAEIRRIRKASNETQLALIHNLRVLHDYALFPELGMSDLEQYGETVLGVGRSTAYEYVRVATPGRPGGDPRDVRRGQPVLGAGAHDQFRSDGRHGSGVDRVRAVEDCARPEG